MEAEKIATLAILLLSRLSCIEFMFKRFLPFHETACPPIKPLFGENTQLFPILIKIRMWTRTNTAILLTVLIVHYYLVDRRV
jgi:hypothetical protein